MARKIRKSAPGPLMSCAGCVIFVGLFLVVLAGILIGGAYFVAEINRVGNQAVKDAIHTGKR